jgi:hypothetical protein
MSTGPAVRSPQCRRDQQVREAGTEARAPPLCVRGPATTVLAREAGSCCRHRHQADPLDLLDSPLALLQIEVELAQIEDGDAGYTAVLSLIFPAPGKRGLSPSRTERPCSCSRGAEEEARACARAGR